MGIRNTQDERKVALFDSVTGFAFGPVFDNDEQADDFLQWFAAGQADTVLARSGGGEVELDLRLLTAGQLEVAHAAWQADRAGA